MNTINVHRCSFSAKFWFQIWKYCVHRCWFSPKIWIQEIIVFTDVGFHLNSGFTKILCTPIFPLLYPWSGTRSQSHRHIDTQTHRQTDTSILWIDPALGPGRLKLDGVGPVDNRPSTDKLHHFVKKNKTKKHGMWHMTCDTWHVARDMWHVTRDMWHMTHLGGWTFSQNFSSLALTVCDLWYYEDMEEKPDDSIN